MDTKTSGGRGTGADEVMEFELGNAEEYDDPYWWKED
jgi:hypothetical protein